MQNDLQECLCQVIEPSIVLCGRDFVFSVEACRFGIIDRSKILGELVAAIFIIAAHRTLSTTSPAYLFPTAS